MRENNIERNKYDKITDEACFSVYPEECCDAAEISEEEFDNYMKQTKKGFWASFVENFGCDE